MSAYHAHDYPCPSSFWGSLQGTSFKSIMFTAKERR